MRGGFTLIELLVVMAIVATLLALAYPRYWGSLERARETVLKENLARTRDAIDKFFGDTGKYPESLEELVARKYLRGVPRDPITDSERSWVVIAPEDAARGGVYDVRSGATGNASNGVPFAEF